MDQSRSSSTYTDEQSHCIRLLSSSDVHIERVRFQNSPGDGVYLLGAGEVGDPWSERVWIENSIFTGLVRNGISIQRGVQDLYIRGNNFQQLGDQAVSAEPSGSGSPRRISIENNYIRTDNAAWAIALSGARTTDLLYDLTFRNNVIEKGSAYFLRINGLVVEGNTIVGDPWHGSLRLEYVINGNVSDNTVTGTKVSNVEGVIRVRNEESYLTSGVVVRDNVVNVNPGSTGIYVEDPRSGITITGNTLNGSSSKRGIGFENVLVLGLTRSNLVVSGNTIQNFENGISISTRGDKYSGLTISNNIINHSQQPPASTIGIMFNATGPYLAFAQLLSNTFGAGIQRTIVLE